MNSRERVLATVQHRTPDRLPIDLGGMRSTGIMSIAYNNLKRNLGMSNVTTRMHDIVQQLAQPDIGVLNRFQIDVIDFGSLLTQDLSLWKDWTLPDGSLCRVPTWLQAAYSKKKRRMEIFNPEGDLVSTMPDGCLYFEQPIYPLVNGEIPGTTNELRAAMSKVQWSYPPCSPWDRSKGPGFWEWLGDAAGKARASTNRAIMLGFGANLLEWGQFLCSNEVFLLMLGAEPQKAEKLLDMLVEIHMGNLEKLLPAIKGKVDIVVVGDDLGMQSGLQISPAMYRRVFKPRHGRIYREIRERSGAFVFMHCCGSIAPVIGDLVDIGVDILNPIQTSAANMDPKRLKKDFGQHITFWGGGCDTQVVLPNGKPDEIEQHVKERIDIFAPGGGFVFNQVHNIMANVPPENVIAMLDAAIRYGKY